VKRVLNVGQCVPDHASISRMLVKHFQVEIDQGHQAHDTLARLRQASYDLVLINRKLDADYTDGLEIIRTMKSDESLRHIPVMLVSNYPEHQERAVAEGAEPGFGKMQLGDPETIARIEKFLA
jgi:CheY-like chemotaxis protein